MTRVFANGGGAGPKLQKAYRRFAQELEKTKPLLYVPLAMEPPEYPGCLAWAAEELACLQVEIRMAESGEEMAGLPLAGFCGVFIGGGNTYVLLERLRSSGAFEKLKAYLESGGPVFGGSAGAALLGRDIDTCRYTDENLPGLRDTSGLDALHGLSLLCHYESGMEIPDVGHPVLALREEQTLIVQGGAMEILAP